MTQTAREDTVAQLVGQRASEPSTTRAQAGEGSEMSDENLPPDYPLGEWVTEQRRRHEHGELNGDRIAELEDLPNGANTDK